MEINVNDTGLFYQKSGEGPALILLHGNGEDHHIFDALSEKLRSDFTLYAVDSRNHGSSDRTGDYSYTTMAADILAFIEALGLAPADIIGFSDGAIVALLLALHHPACVERMALLGVNLSPDDFTEESLEYVRTEYGRTKDPLLKLMLEQPDIKLSELEAVTAPTLVVAADDDIFKPEAFERIAETLPHAHYLIMEGHDHDSYITGSDVLYPDLSSFFTRR